MLSVLLYLLKANAALLLFAVAYFGLLRRLTFFTLNRVYLLFALLFAAVYPALPVPALLPAEAAPAMLLPVVGNAGVAVALPAAGAPAVDWAAVGVALYGAGVVALLGRLLMQLVSLARLRRASRPAVVQGQAVRVLPGEISPFSFGQSIYLNPAQHPGPELAAVLRHELVHVRQWHTVDVLLTQLALAAAWCNPAAWLLRRALLDNLEYLADHAVLEAGLDRRAYQYSLLRLSHAANGLSLVSHFTFPTLKNRIAMMNKPFSSSGQLARYFVAGPLVLAVALGFSAARAQVVEPVAPVPVLAETARATPAPPAPAAEAQAVPAVSHRTGPVRKTHSSKPLVARTDAANPAPTQGGRLVSKISGPQPVYYVDGNVTTDAINGVDPKDIASVNVFKGEQARRLAGEAGARGIVVVTTKQKQNTPEVLAFNEKMGIVAAPVVLPPAPSVPYLAAPALAYITQRYPGARLLGVAEVKAADGSPSRYQAEVAIGRRPGYLLFDGQGQFISDSYTSYLK
ncbi:M56 family metallopeptidase [Hymenobacter negativus]|uniref:Peptidase M56 domain-containing protein n=1 Tax=Hymenobacter negativus TaxID=2795026 RepID=A0ABS3QHK3_9BACT|nr:M56 family metallopeptidase [Hymenobacter negativus]MBO2010269.1 hypothetical protein [Hymenobacter negativus]